MASQGPNSPGTGADDASVGTLTWSTPSNILVSDTSYAIINSATGISHYLKATNFGFSIPTGATINGILVEIEKKSAGAGGGFAVDSEVKLVHGDGSIGTTNKADTTTHWSSTESYVPYGGSSDDWSEGLTVSDINNSNFGVVLSINKTYTGGPVLQHEVNHIRITVSYTTGGGNSPTGVNDMLSFFL